MPSSKNDFRTFCLDRLKKPKANKRYKDHLINQMLHKLLCTIKPKAVLFYLPLPFEADITQTLSYWRRRSVVYVPFMEAESFKMVLYRLPTEINKFNIKEPGNSSKRTHLKAIDIAIIPCVGIDGQAKRIGFGKGMYDRFFANERRKSKKIFLQSESCVCEKLLCEAHDISADVIITPQSILKKSALIDRLKRPRVPLRGKCHDSRNSANRIVFGS